MNHSYPNNCKECYKRIMGTCLLWRQVRILGYNKHPNCPENEENAPTIIEADNESEE